MKLIGRHHICDKAFVKTLVIYWNLGNHFIKKKI